jgi:demethylmenaquinone methyltransferase/2-methoxy-6-polyprenyl-1,4-benzoquinol methylase
MAAPGTLEASQVEAMFDRIAGGYDLINSLMTAGLHHRWRTRAVQLAQVGDLALEALAHVAPGGRVVGLDFSAGMLALAQDKDPGAQIEWLQGNALALEFADNAFDAATVGFGARNFADLDRGLAEMVRVVKPGGRVVVLEITTPQRQPLAGFFALWFDRVVPVVGRLLGDPGGAYSYLPSSVRRFPGPEALAVRLAAAGLTDVRYILTAGGIIALHVGTVKP